MNRAKRQFLVALGILLIVVAGLWLFQGIAKAQDQTPIPAEDRTLLAVDPNCNQVKVQGTGWVQTNATVELATRPAEANDERQGLAGTTQVFPTADNRIEATIPVPDVPNGRFVVVVLVDNMLQDPHTEPFTIPVCSELPFTGANTFQLVLLGLIVLTAGAVILLMTRRIQKD